MSSSDAIREIEELLGVDNRKYFYVKRTGVSYAHGQLVEGGIYKAYREGERYYVLASNGEWFHFGRGSGRLPFYHVFEKVNKEISEDEAFALQLKGMSVSGT